MTFVESGYEENCIEWIRDADSATLSLSQRRTISRIEQLAKSHPDECKITARNSDGSICALVPVCWIKIGAPRTVSEEQREKARNTMNTLHSKRGSSPCKSE